MAFPTGRKSVGFKHKQREGDWIVTYQVVEHNKKNGCNVWEVVKHTYKPLPPLSDAIAAIERERSYEYTKNLRGVVQ